MAPGPRRLPLVPLERGAFARFGDVLDPLGAPGRAVNLGTVQRHDRVAALENTRSASQPNVALFRCAPQALPFRATLFERHPHSTQLFAALRGGRWLLVVAPSRPDGTPDETAALAFACGPGQGINLARGVWHHPVIALDEPAELLMLAWEDGSRGDGEEFLLAEPIDVVAPAS